ncbi:MAG: 3'-5' exonuclease [Clostridium sp.]
MPKCSICGTSKIFLKLTNGLCNDCKVCLDQCEDKYKTLLENTTNESFNKDKLILNILALSVDVRKFENCDICRISSKDCDALLDVVKNMNPSIKVSKEDDKIKFTHSIENPLYQEKLSSKKESETLSSLPAYDSTKVALSNSTKNTNVSDTNIDMLTLPNINLATIDENESLIDMSDHIITNFNETTEDTIQNEDSKDKLPLSLDIAPSNFSLSSSEKSEILSFLDILNDISLSLDEKAYALFTLKEKYLDTFNISDLNTLFEVDFNALYNNTLKKLSISLSCPKEKVYSLYNYVSFNIQTTGIKINSNAIIEIAAIRVRYGQIEDTFHSLVNPLQTISLATENKTKLSNSALALAPTLDVVLQEFIKFCMNLDLVTHNMNFNYKFLDSYSQKLFKKPLDIDTTCTIKLYRTRYKQFHGEPTKDCSLLACCFDLLSNEDISLINDTSSIALSSALGTFKLYEVIKTRYK